MAVTKKTKNGKTIVLLNPAEKGKKYASELINGYKLTNSGVVKKDEKGKKIKLKPKERAYRSGYLDSRNDNAKAYKSKKRRK